MQTTSRIRSFHLLKLILLASALFLTAQTVFVRAAEIHVVDGAFGIEFDKVPDALLAGASIDGSPVPMVLYNIGSGVDQGTSILPEDLRLPSLGWRHFEPSLLSPKLRSRGMRFFILQTDDGEVAMIAALLPRACDELASFLARSITHKYQVKAQNFSPHGNALQSITDVQLWTIGGRHIALTCGDIGYLVYADPARIEQWAENLQVKNNALFEREKLALLAQANRLVPGHGNNLPGAFGLLFSVPVPDHQSLTTSQKIVYDGVRLSPPYDKATYELVLADGGYPVRIAGEFEGIEFELVTRAFTARFGVPFKTSPNHVQYNVNGDYLTLHRLNGRIRISVVHTEADKARRTPASELAAHTDENTPMTEGPGQ